MFLVNANAEHAAKFANATNTLSKTIEKTNNTYSNKVCWFASIPISICFGPESRLMGVVSYKLAGGLLVAMAQLHKRLEVYKQAAPKDNHEIKIAPHHVVVFSMRRMETQ